MATLDSNGLTIDRFPDILEEIEDNERSNIDPNIYTRDDELLGQFNNIISERLASLNELGQALYDAFNIAKAEGKNLDDLAALRGASRIGSSPSKGTQYFTAEEGKVITAGSIVLNKVTQDRFIVENDTTVSGLSCITGTYSVKTLLDSTVYTININDVDYTYTSDASATAVEILDGIKADIDADLDATFTATVVSETIIFTTSISTPLKIVATTYIGADQITSSGNIVSEVDGEIVAPAGVLTEILTPISGWISTTNPSQLILGRLEETDEELRIRIPLITSSGSTGTIPSIEGALLNNIAGIISVKTVENTTAIVDIDGRPAHSYEVILVGGDNTDIANELWRTKPAGISLYGNTNEIIVDSNGNLRSIDFTRPTAVNIACRVQYTKYDEEIYPSDGDVTIATIVEDYINALGVDEDIIPQRMNGPIYGTVAGIDSLVIEVQVIASPGDPPLGGSWQATRLPIAIDEFANITNVDITVLEI